MKKFTIGLLGAIFITLIASSIQSVTADDSTLLGVDIIPTKDSEFQVHLQVVVRDSQGQLVSVTESTNGYYVPHDATDEAFDRNFGKKEIVTVDDIKYEKVQWVDTKSSCEDESCKDIHQNVGKWNTNFFGDFNEFGFLNIPLFQALTSTVIMEEDDNVTNQWTVLRAMDE